MDYVVIILQKYAYFSVNCIELDYKCNILKLFTWALNYILVDCPLSSTLSFIAFLRVFCYFTITS